MEKQNLEKRMYGLVPYNISDIQKAIQFGHSVVEYSLIPEYKEEYLDWAKNWKTFIILNGGTTNKGKFPGAIGSGTLNQHWDTLHQNGIKTSVFHEPDLGDQLTAITFIVDERVFNKEKYPDFISQNGLLWSPESDVKYKLWVESIGGPTNEFLRKFLSQFRLA